MGKLDGKVAIVAGGAGWLGRGICLALAKEGAKVTIADINAEAADEAADELRALGHESIAVVCDAGDQNSVNKMVQEVVDTFGAIGILVNAAQSGWPAAPTHEGWTYVESISEEQWETFFRTGIHATWHCCKAVFPHMKNQGGKIINFGSITGLEGWVGMADYNSTKEAVRGFSRTAAREWGKYGINVNVICPSALTASRIETTHGKDSPEAQRRREFIEEQKSKVPMRRVGDPEKDIGRAIVFLASEDSDFITGQTLNVDGGAHIP